MQGAKKLNLCQAKGSYLFGNNIHHSRRAAQSDAFAISTMADTRDLWQNTENFSETLFPICIWKGLAWV